METKIELNTSYLSSLELAGLSSEQALIYSVLLQNGPLSAGNISKKTPYKRGLVYKILDSMVDLGVVIKREDLAKIAIFEPAHPLKLKRLAEKREEEAQSAQKALAGVLNNLISEFNLSIGKPGFQVFEGANGMKTVLYDTLQSKTEILTYIDIAAILKYIPDINKEYVARRERLNIKKRGLVVDSPANRQYLANYYTHVTDTRLIAADDYTVESIMQIYDNKISYLNLQPGKMIGIIIGNPEIYNMHKWLFEKMWEQAKLIG